jgi:anti-sigma-K factor RskA
MTADIDRNILAAEYIIGTLDDGERGRAEAMIGIDGDFAKLVQYWERRLGALHGMVAPIEPPAEIWDKIAAKLGDAEQTPIRLPEIVAAPAVSGDNVVDLSRRLGRWRVASAGLSAIAASFAALLIMGKVAPDRLPAALRPKPQIIEVAKNVETPRFVAVLQKDATSPAFILTVDVEHKNLTVRRVAAQESGKSYELWLISDKYPAPRSLGVVDHEFTQPRALASYDPDTINSATYAITLEPEGGSPSGSPSGPPLWTGNLVEAVPPR